MERADGAGGAAAAARYCWDVETGILSARLAPAGSRARVAESRRAGPASCVHVIGDDGSWLSLDVANGRVRGVEIAVWPPVRLVGALEPPPVAGDAVVAVAGGGGAGSCEVTGAVVVHADRARRHYRFRVGAARAAEVLRAGRDVLLEATAEGSLAGVWILNVPPSPATRDHDDRPH